MSSNKNLVTQEKKSQNYNWYNEINNEVHEFFQTVLADKRRGAVLDIGEGEGKHAIYSARIGFEGHGIHTSSDAIKRARAFASKTGVNESTHFRVGDVFSLPYPGKFFDVVVDFGCLHHIRKGEWDAYLESLLRVMKDDAHLSLTAYSLRDKHAPSRKRRFVTHQGHYDYFFTKKELKEVLNPFFEVIKFTEENMISPEGLSHTYFHVHAKRFLPEPEIL